MFGARSHYPHCAHPEAEGHNQAFPFARIYLVVEFWSKYQRSCRSLAILRVRFSRTGPSRLMLGNFSRRVVALVLGILLSACYRRTRKDVRLTTGPQPLSWFWFSSRSLNTTTARLEENAAALLRFRQPQAASLFSTKEHTLAQSR